MTDDSTFSGPLTPPALAARTAIVIPARLAATRLPRKPLLPIAGVPMIVQVWRRAAAAGLARTIVACAEPEIAEAVTAAGGEAVLTDADLPSGSDRVHAAMEAVDPTGAVEIVINLQGDLPTITARAILASLGPLADPGVDIATLVAEITDPAERDDPNVVKAALAPDPTTGIGRALYFSRQPVPSGAGPLYHHIGLYAFRRAALRRFVGLAQTELERRERLEQLRAMEAGMRLDAAVVDTIPFGVDTPADLAKARAILEAEA